LARLSFAELVALAELSREAASADWPFGDIAPPEGLSGGLVSVFIDGGSRGASVANGVVKIGSEGGGNVRIGHDRPQLHALTS
jgi:hypothetical protein